MENTGNPSGEEERYCQECQVGIYRMTGATYYTWIDDEIITVQDFPCWVCDVCGNRCWDRNALLQLNMLLSPNAGKPLVIRSSSGSGKKSSAPKKHRTAL